ncbi:hypothetical protein BT63DRAFT_462311 [Microthyrium microscopicum]|uniref:Uncharacterized protein n=1 Tax=Microthyrium microscopicum TaxID=703497 RepID=A0A6A6UTK5_9PEZI|nr:hypothetical protein BT63DRAFT_462311 [Microthyrium microscopicum]
MVLGILTAIAACPAIVGTTEAVRQGQRKNSKEQHRGLKTNVLVSCSTDTRPGKEVNGGALVLRNNKIYVSTPSPSYPEGRDDEHLFAGYFLAYPEKNWGRQGEGLVSTISDDPPQLNWVYVDSDTYEVKYGLKVDSLPHIVGPWDCTRIDKRITLEGWEGFMVVREEPGEWALYFDREDDGLRDKVSPDKRILEVTMARKERRQEKPKPESDSESEPEPESEVATETELESESNSD